MRLNLSADEVLSTTRAVRKRLDFDRPVPREVIEECLALAVQAPTGSNRQGWQWVFVTDAETKAELGELYRSGWERYAGAIGTVTYPEGDPRRARQAKVHASASYLAENMHRAPVLMVPCIEGATDGMPSFAAASVWGSLLPAVWSFMLAARERGLGTAWTTLHMIGGGQQRAAELLGIPDGYGQAGLFPIAYTVGTEFQPASRLDLGSITHWERWGAAAATPPPASARPG